MLVALLRASCVEVVSHRLMMAGWIEKHPPLEASLFLKGLLSIQCWFLAADCIYNFLFFVCMEYYGGAIFLSYKLD